MYRVTDTYSQRQRQRRREREKKGRNEGRTALYQWYSYNLLSSLPPVNVGYPIIVELTLQRGWWGSGLTLREPLVHHRPTNKNVQQLNGKKLQKHGRLLKGRKLSITRCPLERCKAVVSPPKSSPSVFFELKNKQTNKQTKQQQQQQQQTTKRVAI